MGWGWGLSSHQQTPLGGAETTLVLESDLGLCFGLSLGCITVTEAPPGLRSPKLKDRIGMFSYRDTSRAVSSGVQLWLYNSHHSVLSHGLPDSSCLPSAAGLWPQHLSP